MIHGRWFNFTVFALWLAGMSWLFWVKIRPDLVIGDPPNDNTILAAQQSHPTNGWDVFWNDRKIGWAVNTTSALPRDLTQINSTVHIDSLPLKEIIPRPIRGYLAWGSESTRISVEAASELVFDPLGKLSRFSSQLQLPSIEPFKVQGTIDGPRMTVSMHWRFFNTDHSMPTPRAMLRDEFSPQTHLPGLRNGQAWTVDVFSPMRPEADPLEVLHAKVEGRRPMLWKGRLVQAWVVVYRVASKADPEGEVRGKTWVHPNGEVLQQEAKFSRATLAFRRLPDERARELAEQVRLNNLPGFKEVKPWLVPAP
jgi:hypothetical protein